ncbi:ABC transporter substrate-binding protein [Bradyrhizobium zhanjiangense]|nr:ABC transporter substrate-binding protein [Bradyrhizobium zhanjiangense]
MTIGNQSKFGRVLCILSLFAGTTLSTSTFAADLTSLAPDKYKSAPIIIGTTATMPPVESVDPATGQVIGIEADLARAIGKKLSVNVDIQNVAFDGLLAGMQAGRFDIAMSGLADTVQRQQAMDFVDWYVSGVQLIVPKGNPKKVTSLETLCGHTLGGTRASTEFRRMEAVAKNCGSTETALVATENSPSGLLSLKAGRVDVFAVNFPSGMSYVQANPELELVPGQFKVIVRGVAIAKSNGGLRDAWQAGLKAIIDDGQYDEILKRWGAPDAAYKQATINAGTE